MTKNNRTSAAMFTCLLLPSLCPWYVVCVCSAVFGCGGCVCVFRQTASPGGQLVVRTHPQTYVHTNTLRFVICSTREKKTFITSANRTCQIFQTETFINLLLKKTSYEELIRNFL